jgi:hypothetical protein
MKNYTRFADLVDAAATGELPRGWIHRPRGGANVDIAFAVTSDADYDELELVTVEGEERLRVLHEAGMEPWIDTDMFEDVISLREEKLGKRDIDDIALAVEYYVTNDTFMD